MARIDDRTTTPRLPGRTVDRALLPQLSGDPRKADFPGAVWQSIWVMLAVAAVVIAHSL